MDPVFVEKWDAAALKVRVLRYTSSRPFFFARALKSNALKIVGTKLFRTSLGVKVAHVSPFPL